MNVSQCMYDVCISMQDWGVGGGGGGMPHQEIFRNLDALRLLLRPFWDKHRAVVAVWLMEYAFTKPGDIAFPQEKVLRLAEQQCWQQPTRRMTGELLSARKAIHLRTY